MSSPDNDQDKTQAHQLLTRGAKVGHYEIIERIGSGGMGEVFLADDTKLRRRVALKFLPFQTSADEDVRARFVREAQAAAKLNHPNIVTIYEVAEHNGRPYFVMEHVEGSPLSNHALEATLTSEQVLEIAIGICEGLSKAHDAGIVHRDIKAANIVLDSDSRPKILDFGLATIRGDQRLTQSGTTVGTVAYMSPEQVEGKKVDQRSDLFSLGVVLYELIAGRTPFKRDNNAATMQAILADTPEPLARYKSGVSVGVENLIFKLLDKDQRTRYQTASGVLADLLQEKKLIDSGLSGAMSRSALSPALRRKRTIRRLAFSGTTVIVLIILALVLKPWTFEVSTSEEAHAAENRLAVMYFDNLVDPADASRLGEIVTNLIITDLSESPQLSVVSSQRLYDILKRLGKESTRSIDRATASQVAIESNAQWMLTGTILQTEPAVVITTQMVDVASGQVVASQRSSGQSGESIFSQIGRLTTEIKSDLALPATGTLDHAARAASVTTESEEAFRLYLEGQDLLRKHYRPDARSKFLEAIAVDSTFTMAYFQLAANWSSSLGAPDFIRQAVKYSHKASDMQRLYILALADFIAHDVNASVAGLEEIVREFPDEKNAYLQLARIHSGVRSDNQTAVKYYLEALRIDPTDQYALNQIAYAYYDLGEFDKALEHIDRYIELVPDEPNPYDSRGEILAAAGQIDEAIASYRQALNADPKFTPALRTLAAIYGYTADYARADSCARALVAHANKNVRSTGRLMLAFVTGRQGKMAEAMEIIDQGIAADQIEDVAWYLQGMKLRLGVGALSFRGRHEEAIARAEAVVELVTRHAPDSLGEGRDNLALALAMAGEIKRAKDIIRIIENKVNRQSDLTYKAAFFQLRGQVHLAAGETDSAITNFEQALAIESRSGRSIAKFRLARAYLLTDRPADAIPLLEQWYHHFDNLFRRSPIDDVTGHYYLGQAYEMVGKKQSAIEQYQLFLDIWKDADPEITLLGECRDRLAQLKASS